MFGALPFGSGYFAQASLGGVIPDGPTTADPWVTSPYWIRALVVPATWTARKVSRRRT